MWLFSKNREDKIAAAMQQSGQSYAAIVARQFNKNRLAVWSLRFFIFILALAVFADFLANDKPIFCSVNVMLTNENGVKEKKTKIMSPVLHQYFVDLKLSKWNEIFLTNDWSQPSEQTFTYNFVIFPPITYRPEKTDVANASLGPFEKQRLKQYKSRHYLGTDHMGRDVFSGMIHGTRIAMLVGIVAMSIATFIGILLGAMAGYFGDNRLRLSRAANFMGILGLIAYIFIAFVLRGYAMGDNIGNGYLIYELLVNTLIFSVVMLIAYLFSKLFCLIPFLGAKTAVPVDILVMRLIEIVTSIPVLILILAILAIIKTSSIYYVMAIIGAVSWTSIAKFIRAELLRVRSLEYIEAAQAFGYSEYRIILRHAIPNALAPVLIAVAFGIASAILTESFLSFIGVGVPPEQVTWGSLLKASRDAGIKAWWLAVFPGVAIFVTVTIFNLIGEGLTDALDPRLKQ
jgi:peptide/nickel transport system permease protein